MNTVTIRDFNLGGIADSQYQGQANSVAEMVGFDIHSEPGILKHNQRLYKESGTTVDDLVKKILVCSDGKTYLFGSTSGKIWSRGSTGLYFLEATAAPTTGLKGIVDAWEYQGYIYYAMSTKLGRVVVGSPTSWAGRDDNWQAFNNGDLKFHPMIEANQVLYIGDGKDLAQVDAGVFSGEALKGTAPRRVKSLGTYLTDILSGIFVDDNKATTTIQRWNTWSLSYSSSDDIPEIGINCFLRTDNFVLVNVGTKGNFYLYNGGQLDNFKRIPGDWAGDKQAYVHPNASCNMFGLPLFGLSNVTRNPARNGVYSLGGYDRNYPKVLNLEWLISTGHSDYVEIGAIELVGTNLLVSWKDPNDSHGYGVDILDTAVKNETAWFTTRTINISRNDSKTLSGYVAYRDLPEDSSIQIYYKTNYATSWTLANTTVDTIRKTVYLKEALPEANTIQIKVLSTAATGAYVNESPEIELAEFSFA